MPKNEFFNLLINSIQMDNFQTFYSLLCSEEAPTLINQFGYYELREIDKVLYLRMRTDLYCSVFYQRLGFDNTMDGVEHVRFFLLNVRNVNLDEVGLGFSATKLFLNLLVISGYTYVGAFILACVHLYIFGTPPYGPPPV